MAASKEKLQLEKEEAKKRTTCNTCNKIVKKNEKGVNCEYCSHWFHTKCEQIPDEDYAFMIRRGEQIHWFCTKCNTKAVDVLKLVQNMQDAQAEMRADIVDISKKVDDVVEMKDKGHCDKVRSLVREEVHEIQEKEKKCTNIIIRGLLEKGVIVQESDDDDESQSDEDSDGDNSLRAGANSDRSLVEHLFYNVLDQKDVKIQTVRRIEQKDKDGKLIEGRDSLIIAQMESKNMKYKILRISKKLKDTKGWEKVFLGPDRTKKEQEEDKVLRDELKLRRSQGEKNLMIRQGKIVPIPENPAGTVP
jgi:hypothetical protein